MTTLGQIDVAGMTDTGRVRKENEDQFVVAHLSKSLLVQETSLKLLDQTRLFGGSQGHLLIVADGVGSMTAGKEASAIAVDTVTNYVLQLDLAREDGLRDELVSAIERAQETVHRLSEGNPQRRGMGTTLTLAYVLWPRLCVVHVGDSRCYLMRELVLRQISRDQTLAEHRIAEGTMTPEEAERSRLGNVLINAIGGGGANTVQADVYDATLEIGDAVLLCSDGLTRHVDDDGIAAILGAQLSARRACRALVDAANAGGGEDNITAVVAYFRDSAPELEGVPSGEEETAVEARPIPEDHERDPAPTPQPETG